MSNRTETSMPAIDSAAADAPKTKAGAKASGGGLSSWMPLIISIVAMPLLAYATTTFVLVPKLQQAAAEAEHGAPKGKGTSHEAAKGSGAHGKSAGKGVKTTAPLSKILVNITGSAGMRYLLTSLTLVGNAEGFKDKIESNKDQLLDLASSTLCSKTLSDLEKPTIRTQLRNELLVVFNNALGDGLIQDIYITELAIQ